MITKNKVSTAFSSWILLTAVLTCLPAAAQTQAGSTSDPLAAAAPVSSKRPTPALFRTDGTPRDGVSYGPFREGQQPGDPDNQPTESQIREDLHLMAKHWQMLRVYGSDAFAELVCRVIRQDGLDLKVMVGAWVGTESTQRDDGVRVDQPEGIQANRRQVEQAVRIANDYPDVVAAVSIGNESQVFWSFHALQPERLLAYVRQARQATKAPITVADDFMYWETPASRELAAELDFIVTHAYAMWHGRSLDQALAFTQEKYAVVQAMHPQHLIVLGETGWATSVAKTGDQAERIAGQPGEPQQAQFFRDLTAWTRKENIPLFYFEAFDEPWKGGDDPQEVEKHWGLYRADRTPKSAVTTVLEKP